MKKTIFCNGTILTMDKNEPKVEAVVIEDGKILEKGDYRRLRGLYPDAEIFDLEGNMMMPGFNDSHCHMVNLGLTITTVNLKGAKSIAEIGRRVREFIEKTKPEKGSWIWGRGWHDTDFEVQRMPTKEDLDDITADYPLALMRSCGHVYAVNSKALEIAGITKDTPEPPGGEIRRNEKGEPSGILTENAIFLINKKIPQFDKDRLKIILRKACEEARRNGVTTVQSEDFKTAGGYKQVVLAYRELLEEGTLPIRVDEQMYFDSADKLAEFLAGEYKELKEGFDDMVTFGPLKILLDGSLGGKTAYMKEPYIGEGEYRGVLIHQPGELYDLMETAHKNGIQVACHAIGDGAIQLFTDTVEKLQKKFPKEDIRHRIIHCQITDSRLLKRIADLRICVDAQPSFVSTDYKIVEDRVGKEKASTSYAWRTMHELGIPIGFGSDCPVENIDPFAGLYAAVTRMDLDGKPEGGWNPQERLTIEEALMMYTMGSAYVCGKEQKLGSIEVGKYADMIVLNRNLLEIEAEEIPEVKVLYTVVNGIVKEVV